MLGWIFSLHFLCDDNTNGLLSFFTLHCSSYNSAEFPIKFENFVDMWNSVDAYVFYPSGILATLRE